MQSSDQRILESYNTQQIPDNTESDLTTEDSDVLSQSGSFH